MEHYDFTARRGGDGIANFPFCLDAEWKFLLVVLSTIELVG